jgi:8-oxo-dGTP diphosphatase
MVQVVAAILERDGRILVGQRTAEQSHPLKWEFPGGKVEAGESPEQALTRELEEELAIRETAGQEIARYQFRYPGKNPIELIFFRVTGFEGEPENLIFHDLRWQPRGALRDLDFLDGDRPFLDDHYTGAMATAIKRIDPGENEFLASLEAKAKQPNPFLRAMANRPEVLKSFIPFYGAITGPGTVERRIKSMVYLTTSFANQCAFCIAANLPGGRKAGLTEAELQALEQERDEGFSPVERAAIRYARELTRSARAEASREEMFQHFTHEQIVEITLTIAMANFTNRFNNGLAIFPEA